MNLRLHHLGILVKDIPQTIADYTSRFGYEVQSALIHDAVQTAFVQFVRLPGERVHVEFVSPDGPSSKLTYALNRGGGLNHLCYATDDIDLACAELRTKGLYLLQAPVLAAAFSGRRIAWLLGQDRIPVELVEQGTETEL
jgi:methylmalonyl-CoA/ethylmalonyl-CoA epimerase